MNATQSPSISRRFSAGGRPQNAPMGPRTRNPSRSSVLSSSRAASPRESLYMQGASPLYSASSSTEPSDSKTQTLPVLTEREYDAPPLSQEDAPSSPSARSTPSIPEEPQEPLSVKSTPKVAALTPSPQIKFESVPVQWKGLSLEAALWTFDSKELQDLVSRAIRGSSRESFIRVLSMETLDKSLPAELDRLNTLKAVTQSRYRFTVHRRTMLLQGLHSFSGYNDKDKDVETITTLTSQLSQTTAECDQLLEELLQIADQVNQITRLQDTHWASALAIALRKLNSSYGRRTSDLLKARDKIKALEAELNDAWQQAEDLAREMDNAEVFSDDEEEDAVIEVAEVVSLNHRKSPSGSSQMSVQPFDVLSLDAISRIHSEQSQATSPISPTTSPTSPTIRQKVIEEDVQPLLSPTQTKLPSPTASELEMAISIPDLPMSREVFPSPATQASETASIHSTRSVKSSRTTRTMDTSRVENVTAARRRSQRTSRGSLRMPTIKSVSRKGSHPPVPSLPSTSSVTPDRTSRVESFLDFGSRENTDSDTDNGGSDGAPAVRQPMSIDDIEVVARTPTLMIQTRDDIHVMPSRSAAEKELVTTRRSQFSLDHQHPFANEESVNHSIPSIWLLQDAPKTPAERVESMMRDRGHVKMGSLQRLKSLTKRYSLPFPAATRPKSNRTVTGS